MNNVSFYNTWTDHSRFICVDLLRAPIFASRPSTALLSDVISTNANKTLLVNALISTNYYTLNDEKHKLFTVGMNHTNFFLKNPLLAFYYVT